MPLFRKDRIPCLKHFKWLCCASRTASIGERPTLLCWEPLRCIIARSQCGGQRDSSVSIVTSQVFLVHLVEASVTRGT
jgi:hypothetical protein